VANVALLVANRVCSKSTAARSSFNTVSLSFKRLSLALSLPAALSAALFATFPATFSIAAAALIRDVARLTFDGARGDPPGDISPSSALSSPPSSDLIRSM
jgi:hypothetical protein